MKYSISLRLPSNPFEAGDYIDRLSRKASLVGGTYEIGDIILDDNGFESITIRTDNNKLAHSFVELIAEMNGHNDEGVYGNDFNDIYDAGMN